MPQRLKGHPPGAAVAPPHSGFVTGQTNPPGSPEVQPPDRWPGIVVCGLLALAVWAVFGQTVHHEFVNYDNSIYVYENPDITRGLSLKGIVWAFTHVQVDEWWPLTSISHMLDCELYGLNPSGHHLTNILLHGAAVILLFLVLRNMTGAFWRSAFVAAVFALHPLRVESVAWVTERKDVLSGLFFMLTLGAYVRYVRGPFAVGRYLLVLLFFTLGLMSKAILVTMPFVLLLLDYWPLRRIAPGSRILGAAKRSGNGPAPDARPIRRLIIEKIPFLLLAAAGSATTILAVKGIHPVGELSVPWRIANALVAYATYLWQMIYPVGLAVFYPHPEKHLPLWMVGVSALVLLIISAGVVAGWRKRPYLLVGWLWYLGMLVPVIGLLQVGSQARADRYTYLSQIGLYILVAWGAVGLCGTSRFRRAVLNTASIMIVVGLGFLASVQTTYWRDSVALWLHTLDCTSGNYLAHNNLGALLTEQGKWDEAIQHYEQALQFKPRYAEAHYNLGVAFGARGKAGEAIPHYERAIQFKPDYADAHNNLGNALAAQGKLNDAIPHYERALQLKPDFPEAHYNFGNTLTKQRKLNEAIQHYERALQLKPDYAEAHYNLGNRLAAQGKVDEAIQHYEKAIRLKPNYAEAHNNLGNRLAARKRWNEAAQSFERALQLKPDYAEAHNNFGTALAGQGKLNEAIQHYEVASRLKPDYAEALANLGNALSMQGKLDEAMERWHEALRLAMAQTNTALAKVILKRLELYQSPPPESETP